jgi:hypothetical protein
MEFFNTLMNSATFALTEYYSTRACYEPGQKPHRNAASTVALVPVRSPFPAFLRHF